MRSLVHCHERKPSKMPIADRVIDSIDARILRALVKDPRATVVALAEATGLARNTVHARLGSLEADGFVAVAGAAYRSAALGYRLTAFIMVTVTQHKLRATGIALDSVTEVLEVQGLNGVTDLLVRIVARDADDLYRVAGQVLDIGVETTTTGLVMRRLVDYRLGPLLSQR